MNHAILLPVFIEFSRCSCAYSNAKFELYCYKKYGRRDHKMKQVLIITSSIDETSTYIEEYDCDTEHRVQAIPDRI